MCVIAKDISKKIFQDILRSNFIAVLRFLRLFTVSLVLIYWFALYSSPSIVTWALRQFISTWILGRYSYIHDNFARTKSLSLFSFLLLPSISTIKL